MKKKNAFLLLFFLAVSLQSQEEKINWDAVNSSQKIENSVEGEQTTLLRRRVQINQNIKHLKAPRIFLDSLWLDKARQFRTDQKTAELIGQIESLIPRERQRKRVGELRMRLAELYYERVNAVAANESESWSKRVSRWEKTPPNKRGPRPVLATPRADVLRRDALKLYTRLEAESRRKDNARNKMIERSEVLFYLASTYMDLGERKKAIPYFKELTSRYPNNPNTLSARLNLGDLYFENAKYQSAVPQYLKVASSKDPNASKIRSYALYKLGWAYNNLQKYDKAILAFQKTIEVSKKASSNKNATFLREAYADLSMAYAMSGKYSEGHKYFRSLRNKKSLETFELNAAQVARDRGHYKVADYFYGQLLKRNPDSPLSKELTMERLEMLRRSGDYASFSQSIDYMLTRFGASSQWLKKQKISRKEKRASVDELVSLARRETKNLHKSAQDKNNMALFKQTEAFYKTYFKHVPRPNPDSAENVHEMRFYYAELLYKVRDFPKAAHYYSLVRGGKHANTAAYNKILAYREASKSDKRYAKKLVSATNNFVQKFPNDNRAGDLLYASATEAYEAGASSQSITTLRDIVRRFPNSPRGVEAAERILFIHEKSNKIDAALQDTNSFLKNKKLLATGGSAFKSKLISFKDKAEFKKVELMPESSSALQRTKGLAFLSVSKKLGGSLKEKSLNNAVVLLEKAGAKSELKSARGELLKAFPSSQYASHVYLKQAESSIENANYQGALSKYKQYLATYKKKGKEREGALSNWFYIRAHLEDGVPFEFSPQKTLSSELVSTGKAYLKEYPTGANRDFVTEVLSFRRGASLSEIASFKRLPSLSNRSKTALEDAHLLALARSNTLSNNKKILSQNQSRGRRSLLSKKALGKAAFEVLEKDYREYRSLSLNFNAKLFASSLEKKIKALESVEKKYLGVVSYGDGEFALKSLQRISNLYRGLATEINRAPEDKKALESISKPLDEKGVNYLETCLKKAAELRIAGSALQLCQQELAAVNQSKVPLWGNRLPRPQWSPVLRLSHPMAQSSAEAFKKYQVGKFLLGINLLEKKSAALNPEEKLYFDNLSALLDYRKNRIVSAETTLLDVISQSRGLAAHYNRIASKNLAAIYLNVGAVQAAGALLKKTSGPDADVLAMLGLVFAGQGNHQKAVSQYKLALKKDSSNEIARNNIVVSNSRLKGMNKK